MEIRSLTNKESQLTKFSKFAQSATLFTSLTCSEEHQNIAHMLFLKNLYVNLKDSLP